MVRALPLVVYLGVAAEQFSAHGIPYAFDRLLAWLVAGLFCLCIATRRRAFLSLLRDWLPLAAALTAYDVLRAVGGIGRVHGEAQIWTSEKLFGADPSVWLQAHLWNPDNLHWYDGAGWLVYNSFFFVTPLTLAVLWFRRHDLFRVYRRLLVAIWGMCLLFFALLPTMPPWLASEKGLIGPVTRINGPIGSYIPIFDGTHLWESGVRLSNDVAAFPSLHEGVTVLFAIFFWRRTRSRVLRGLLAAYPLAMALALVYSGEHFVLDLVAGAALAAFVVAAERRVRMRVPAVRSLAWISAS